MIIYGLHTLQSLVTYHPEWVNVIYYDQSLSHTEATHWLETIKSTNQAIQLQAISKGEFIRQFGSQMRPRVAAKIHMHYQNFSELTDAISKQVDFKGLVLHNMQDPHNLGACIRCAAAFGMNAVILTGDRSVKLTPVSHKVASGGTFLTPIYKLPDLKKVLQMASQSGLMTIGTSEHANKSIVEMHVDRGWLLVLGEEGCGLPNFLQDRCEVSTRIPTSPDLSSLNVSVACGIYLCQLVRGKLT
ncbi:RNA methyltransferase [Gammaproteobacteria bacterium]|nr:RNA methyltransferase [Gammaproteobacteria bacterium]